MKLTKMTLWILIGLGSSIALLALIYWRKFSYLIPVSIGICSAAIPLQIILYRQTRTKKERPIFSIFLIMFIICFIFLYTIEKDPSDFIRCTAIAAWATSYAATITLIIDKPLNVYKEL